jgi:hypothetical protein
MKNEPKIKITKNGLYIIDGNLFLDKQIVGIGKDNES